MDDLEHFGFLDGISRPQVAGFDGVGELQPGNFVFGYQKIAGSEPFWPVVDLSGLTDNGSLLVYRRPAQDSEAFRALCASEAAPIAAQWPGILNISGHLSSDAVQPRVGDALGARRQFAGGRSMIRSAVASRFQLATPLDAIDRVGSDAPNSTDHED